MSLLYNCKIFTYLSIVLLLNALTIQQWQLSGQKVALTKPFTVVIDPGHGGKDPGTVWKKIYEKDIVLKISLKLGNYIKNNLPDVKVVYTRQTDVFIDLDKRAPIANKIQADLFISIHVNSSEKSYKPEGLETYFMGPAKSEDNREVAIKENAVIRFEDNYTTKYEGYDPNSPNSFILFSLLQNIHWNQSLKFADNVQKQYFDHTKRYNRGVKQAGFLVLWKTAMPSVLIETGFLTNEDDRKYLTSDKGQNAIAYSIYNAFKLYKEDIESRSKLEGDNPIKDSMPLIILPDTLQIIKDSLNTPFTETSQVKSKIEFLVQVIASNKPITLNSKYFKGLKGIEEFEVNASYKYALGRNTSFNETLKYCKVVKNYFPDAFIIALKDGKIIPLKEALKEIKD